MHERQRHQRFQINSVSATNFRSISRATADLEQLTVLVGPNASGKSNVLDVLRFVKDAFRFDLDAAISMRHGISAIHHERSLESRGDIEISLLATLQGLRGLRTARVHYGFGISASLNRGYDVSREYATIWRDDSDQPIGGFRLELGNLVESSILLSPGHQRRLFEDDEFPDFESGDLALPALLRTVRGQVFRRSDNRRSDRAVYTALNEFLRRLVNMRFYHMFPNVIREPQKLSSTRLLDENAANLASVLRAMERRNGDHSPLLGRLKDYLSRLIPGILDIEVTAAGGYLVVRLKHDSLSGDSWMDLSLESDGTVRLLGLLTALNQSPRPTLIGIEEPELTVHPGALSTLADVLHEAAQTSQLLITTHSPDFIDCITQSRSVENLRIVELVDGVTRVERVSGSQVAAVRQHLFSPGELHRMGELEIN